MRDISALSGDFRKCTSGVPPGTVEGRTAPRSAQPPRSWVMAMGNSRGNLTRNVHVDDAHTVRVSAPRKFSGNIRNIFRGEPHAIPAFEITTADWNEMAAEAFNQHMQEEGISLKELADKIGCSDRTAENYTQARSAPAGLHFLRAIAVIPQFEAKVRWVAALHADGNPAAMREALELVRAAQKFLDARDRADQSSHEEAPEIAGGESLAVGDLFDGVVAA